MTARFTKVAASIWRSPRFQQLDERGKVLMLYFLTSEHQTSAGAYRISDGYVLADLKWNARTYRAARQALIDGGLILFDEATSTVYIERWFKHSPPMNEKHAQGIRRVILDLESEQIQCKAADDFAVVDANRNVVPMPSAGAQRWPVRPGSGRG